MAREVDLEDAQARLPELLQWAEANGERLAIRRGGRVVAELVPVGEEAVAEAQPGDWLLAVAGLCRDDPGYCEVLDEIVRERQRDMPRELSFWWDTREAGDV